MKRALIITTLAFALAACNGEKPAESTYGSTGTLPNTTNTTDTTQTSTGGPGAQPDVSITDTTNTRYGGTTATDTSTTTR